MSNFDFTTILFGSADGTNTYALTNPSTGAAPAYDATINVIVPPHNEGFRPFFGTANEITTVTFNEDEGSNALDNGLENSEHWRVHNPELGLLYDNSAAEYSLYSAVNATGRGNTDIPVLNDETPVSTLLTNVAPLTSVLNTISSSTSLLSIIHSQILGRWVEVGGGYRAAFEEGDSLTFYANYSVPVSNAYSLNGVTSGTVTFTGSDGSNVTSDLASLSVASGLSASVTYRINLVVSPSYTSNLWC
jgi:hypothetical protein